MVHYEKIKRQAIYLWNAVVQHIQTCFGFFNNNLHVYFLITKESQLPMPQNVTYFLESLIAHTSFSKL